MNLRVGMAADLRSKIEDENSVELVMDFCHSLSVLGTRWTVVVQNVQIKSKLKFELPQRRKCGESCVMYVSCKSALKRSN